MEGLDGGRAAPAGDRGGGDDHRAPRVRGEDGPEGVAANLDRGGAGGLQPVDGRGEGRAVQAAQRVGARVGALRTGPHGDLDLAGGRDGADRGHPGHLVLQRLVGGAGVEGAVQGGGVPVGLGAGPALGRVRLYLGAAAAGDLRDLVHGGAQDGLLAGVNAVRRVRGGVRAGADGDQRGRREPLGRPAARVGPRADPRTDREDRVEHRVVGAEEGPAVVLEAVPEGLQRPVRGLREVAAVVLRPLRAERQRVVVRGLRRARVGPVRRPVLDPADGVEVPGDRLVRGGDRLGPALAGPAGVGAGRGHGGLREDDADHQHGGDRDQETALLAEPQQDERQQRDAPAAEHRRPGPAAEVVGVAQYEGGRDQQGGHQGQVPRARPVGQRQPGQHHHHPAEDEGLAVRVAVRHRQPVPHVLRGRELEGGQDQRGGGCPHQTGAARDGGVEQEGAGQDQAERGHVQPGAAAPQVGGRQHAREEDLDPYGVEGGGLGGLRGAARQERRQQQREREQDAGPGGRRGPPQGQQPLAGRRVAGGQTDRQQDAGGHRGHHRRVEVPEPGERDQQGRSRPAAALQAPLDGDAEHREGDQAPEPHRDVRGVAERPAAQAVGRPEHAPLPPRAGVQFAEVHRHHGGGGAHRDRGDREDGEVDVGARDEDGQPGERVAEVGVVVGQELLSEAAAPGEEQVAGGLPVHQVPERPVEGDVLVRLVVEGASGVAEGERAARHPGRAEGGRGQEEGQQGAAQAGGAADGPADHRRALRCGGPGIDCGRLGCHGPQCAAPC